MADYHVARDGKTLGVYPEEQVREYIAQGRIAPGDLVWTAGMPQWRPASEALGSFYPSPPALHWGWVLLLSIVTLGLFYIVWIFVQAVWVRRRIDRKSHAIHWLLVYLLLSIVGETMTGMAPSESVRAGAGALISLVGMAAFVVAAFSVRRSLLDHYNSVEPIGLTLSAAMTFFFGALYFQYHFGKIANWKKGASAPPHS